MDLLSACISIHVHIYLVFSVRCNIYISRLCYDASVCLSVTEVHWHIIANLGFKFRSKFIACTRMHVHLHALQVHAGAREGIIAGKIGGIISCYAGNCLALLFLFVLLPLFCCSHSQSVARYY